jgi:hypothetical protein
MAANAQSSVYFFSFFSERPAAFLFRIAYILAQSALYNSGLTESSFFFGFVGGFEGNATALPPHELAH